MNIYDPKGIVKSERASEQDYLEEKEKIEFKVGPYFEAVPAKTLRCKHCKSDQFKVAQEAFYTAVKCVNCEYEVPIHEG